MRIVVAIDLDEGDLLEAYGGNYVGDKDPFDWDDLINSLDARLDEIYCGKHDHPVKGKVVTMGDFSGEALKDLLDAAEVGAEGIEDDGRRGHIFGSLAEMRQQLEPSSSTPEIENGRSHFSSSGSGVGSNPPLTHFNVNEEGEPYGEHSTLDEALTSLLTEFPEDAVLTVRSDSHYARHLRARQSL